MKLGMQVGLGLGHVVLDGDPAPLPKEAQPLPNFRSMSVVVKRSPISATDEYLSISFTLVKWKLVKLSFGPSLF